MEIKDLQARQGNVEIVATVKEISEPREFEKFGKTGKVANAIIEDVSGKIKLSLWNEQVDKVNVGDKVHIANGYVSEWQGELQLTTGKFGQLEIVESDEETPKKISEENKEESPDDEEEDIIKDDDETPVEEETIE